MSTHDNAKDFQHSGERDAKQIERDLAATRANLGDTLEVLGERLDVKTRATQWAKEVTEQTRRRTKTLVDERGRELGIAAGAAVVAGVAFMISRATRR